MREFFAILLLVFIQKTALAEEATVPRHPVETWWTGGSAIPDFSDRQKLSDGGLDISGYYIANFLGNVSGGKHQDFAYTHTFSTRLVFDLEKIAMWKGATVTWSFADNAGSNLQSAVGNIFPPSNLLGPNTFIFSEFFLTQTLFDGAWVFQVGQLCAGGHFAASPIYGNFVNTAYNGNPYTPFNTFPITTFPSASWGASVRGNWNLDAVRIFYGQVGLYQVSNRVGVDAYHGVDYSIRPGDGTMLLWELGWTPNLYAQPAQGKAPDQPGYPGHYKVGGFFSNATYPTFSGSPNVPNAYGFYFLADQQVTMEPENPSEGLILWGAITWTPQEDISQLPFFASGGLQYTGLLPGRPADVTFLGIAYGQGSRDAIEAQEKTGLPGSSYEIVWEAGHVFQINSWLSIQPDIQYIINPGGTGTIQNAWILGGQLTVSF